MSNGNPQVSVFHFTSRISNAKIRKYKLATERGMASGTPSGAEKEVSSNGRPLSRVAKPSPVPTPTPGAESPSMEPPPAKKPRLKLNVRAPNSPDDTITVSRPKRETNVRFRYSQDMVMIDPDPVPEPVQAQPVKAQRVPKASPASSSEISSLSSATPSGREESPFKDPTPPPASRDDYGDFMSYYVVGGDEPEVEPKAKKAKTTKSSKSSKASRRSKGKGKAEAVEHIEAPSPAPPPSHSPGQEATHPPPVQGPQPPSGSAPPQRRPSQRQQPVQIQPPFAQGPPPPGHRLPHPMPPQPAPPAPLPQPIIRFIDIVHDPKPTRPDTIAEMIAKLKILSAALTDFGGVPAIPATPTSEGPRKADKPKKAKEAPKASKAPAASSNALDSFLSFFGADDDDEDDEEESTPDDFDYVLPEPGEPDKPLMYGIQFIQNALKSWAQQRMSHQVAQQFTIEHHRQLQQAQMQQRRGPGRPRRYDEAQPVQPIIHMDLANTPEGVAIKAFQCVLDSGCLQVNAAFPAELARALRHLYMQIDHLINQTPKDTANWQCMSYGAQISAHKLRVDRFKEAHSRAHEEMLRQRGLADAQMVAQMSMHANPTPPLTQEQLQHVHALELERRRSQQHAAQQPYISQQHLNPLQLGSNAPAPGTSGGNPQGQHLFDKDAHLANPSETPPAFNDASELHEGMPNGLATHANLGTPQTPSAFNKGSAGQVQLDRMKLYMPGYLPRSGQSMKFSFAPHNEAALQVFGSESFPADEEPGPQLPNRGPMGAPPTQPSLQRQGNGNAESPIELDSDMTAEEGPGRDDDRGAAERPGETPSLGSGGFTAINAQPAKQEFRPSSMPIGSPETLSPETIRVATRHPSGAVSASASPAVGSGVRSFGENGMVVRPPVAANFPHPGAVVVNQ